MAEQKKAADPNAGVREQVEQTHEARVVNPDADSAEGTVDARLDNRTGRHRPPLQTFPAKPQQVDGPDVMGQAEHTRRTLQARGKAEPSRGMFSAGPHGLSAESVREDDAPLYGTEGIRES